jgi:hypothetical protein
MHMIEMGKIAYLGTVAYTHGDIISCPVNALLSFVWPLKMQTYFQKRLIIS